MTMCKMCNAPEHRDATDEQRKAMCKSERLKKMRAEMDRAHAENATVVVNPAVYQMFVDASQRGK